MAIRLYKACTPGTRHRVPPNLSSLNNGKPEKSLLKVKKKTQHETNKQSKRTNTHKTNFQKYITFLFNK